MRNKKLSSGLSVVLAALALTLVMPATRAAARAETVL